MGIFLNFDALDFLGRPGSWKYSGAKYPIAELIPTKWHGRHGYISDGEKCLETRLQYIKGGSGIWVIQFVVLPNAMWKHSIEAAGTKSTKAASPAHGV